MRRVDGYVRVLLGLVIYELWGWDRSWAHSFAVVYLIATGGIAMVLQLVETFGGRDVSTR